MNAKHPCLLGLAALTLGGISQTTTHAALPADFPPITIVSNGIPDPGYLFGSLTVSNVSNPRLWSNWFAILQNDGNPVLTNRTDSLGLLGCNGLYVTRAGGKGAVTYLSKDSAFNVLATNQAGNGFIADNRDMHVLPNGHGVITIQDSVTMDLSTLVPGGNPAAKISYNVIQELDVDNNVVFQWRILDHVPITDSYQDLKNPGSYTHVNSVWFDDLDGTIIISCRNTSQILKINRTTGEIVWRLGGKQNEFTFTNAIPEGRPGYGESAVFQVQHSVKRLPNGNLTVFDNGYSDHSDPQWHFDRPYSRAAEYEIDEVHKTAKLVWQCRHTPDIITYNGGDVLRLAGGHTIVTWGNDNNASPRLALTEADEAGNVVTDIQLPAYTNGAVSGSVSGNFTRNVWPLESSYRNVTRRELLAGNSYGFNDGTTNVTGVTLQPSDLDADQYNSVIVSRQPFAPVLPRFLSSAPRLLPVRLLISQSLVYSMNALASFDVASLGIKDPANTSLYYRETPGQGLFVAVPTEYNWVTHQLQADISSFGEYTFGFPDALQVPYPPLLITPAQNAALNQGLPVSFFWTPVGFASSYDLLVSTNSDFSDPVLDQPGLAETRYTNFSALASTHYYWRVKTWNDGGESDWATGAFTTVPPMVQVVAPNGGDIVQRGLPFVIQWQANVAEKIALDLYKGGSLIRILATNTATPTAYTWQVSVTNVPGNDYTLKIRSTTNAALFDFSDHPFSIVDTVPVTVATDPSGLTVMVDGTNYTAPATFNWLSGTAHTLNAPSPQTAPDGRSRSTFASWSDGGAQSNQLTVPFSATTYTASFSKQYLLDVTVTPASTGTVTNNPLGPWYNAGQQVSLTARTNPGYRFYSWQGADQVGNPTQVTMDGSRSVQAMFVPTNFPTLVISSNGPVAPGDFLGTFTFPVGPLISNSFNVVLDNSGGLLYWNTGTRVGWRAVTPSGFVAETPIASGPWTLKDESLTVVDSFPNGDNHDFKLLPNGHALVIYNENRPVDMSQYVSGGRPDAVLQSVVVQEFDANKQVVFQWRALDHLPITDSFASLTDASVDWTHVNSFTLDPLDNNYLLSLRGFCQILKISRTTGQVIWRLGGKSSSFTFVAEHPENAPYYFIGQHNVHRLSNGNLMFFDNGNNQGQVPTPRSYSRALEYHLDEVAMTATLAWEYRHVPDLSANSEGSVHRFRNGNTLVGWFAAAAQGTGPVVTEINAQNQVMFEISTPGLMRQTILNKQVWNSPDLIHSDTNQGILAGQTYNAPNAGVSIKVNSLSGSGDQLIASKHDDAVRFPQFSGKAPQVLVQRVTLSGTGLDALNADLSFDLPPNDFCFDTPLYRNAGEITVYQRATPGQGLFTPLATTFDSGANKLKATTTQFGEFIFAYPDLPEIPLAPVLFGQAAQGSLNQAQPVVFQWTPQGFVRSYRLQLATDPEFNSLVVDQAGLTQLAYTNQSVQAGLTYYWRVNVSNDGGTSDWATASFAAVPAMVQVTVPNGGQVWQRGLPYFVRWNDNIAENVIIDLYKGGVFQKSLATNSGSAYQWNLSASQAIGADYSIKVRSATNSSIFDFSDLPFSIADLVPVTVATDPAGLTVTVDGTNYTAPATFNWLSGTVHTLATPSPQTAANGQSRSSFASWSGGGAQSNQINAPVSAMTNTATFSTQYLLTVNRNPTTGGTVAPAPTGPWYDAGQLVSLTANTNLGYRFGGWGGVDSQSANTAQVTMDAARNVMATFLPASFPSIVIVSNGPVAPGSYIGTIGAKGTATNNFNVVLDGSGTPLSWFPFTNLWRNVIPSGLIAESVKGWSLKDETFALVDTFSGGNGHYFTQLPNGNAIIMQNDSRPVDMSQYFPAGRPDAVLKALILTEVDVNKQVLFQWRSLDHLPIADTLATSSNQSVDWDHPNGVTIDPLDNNYLISLRTFCQIVKVSRTTGEVIWRLGGKHSSFTFVNEHPENAPYYFIGQHYPHRLANGNILFFDNGTMANEGSITFRNYSRAVEYHLDETNMTATLVWEYRHTPSDIFTPSEGIAERLPNGNTHIGWVSAAQNGTGPAVTEVNAQGQIVFEMSLPGFAGQTILTKKVWNTPDLIHANTNGPIVVGQVYHGANAGVAVTVNSLSGSGDQLIVRRHDDAVRLPRFSGKAPQVLMQRITMSGTGITALGADLTFDLPANDFAFETPLYHNPADLTVYQRATPGQGLFTPLTTTYDPGANKLRVTATQMGEFIFTYPDLPEIPLAPSLYGSASQGTVNQAQPVVFQWTPKGFARSYRIQVATDSGFTALVADQAGLTNMSYTLASVQPGTTYYWRVNVSNTGGTSDWAASSFTTVPPSMQVTVPQTGDNWSRGLAYYIRWTNNLAENVNVELYKAGALIRKIVTNAPNVGAYSWTISLTNTPGSDYSIKVRSATNTTVFGTSGTFGLDVPVINPGSLVRDDDGLVRFAVAVGAGAAAQARVWGASTLSPPDWQLLGTVPLDSGTGTFTDTNAPSYHIRFYRVTVP